MSSAGFSTLRDRQAIDMGTVLERWVKRDNIDVPYSPVRARDVSVSLLRFLSGQAEPGILDTLDTFDIHCALHEVGRPLDLG
ncbi:MAG TPA: hypothetical protein VIV60_35415, partial [Polyangiaceae bacterium]